MLHTRYLLRLLYNAVTWNNGQHLSMLLATVVLCIKKKNCLVSTVANEMSEEPVQKAMVVDDTVAFIKEFQSSLNIVLI